MNTIDSQKSLAAIANATKETTVILDFDETLLLRNSTAEYINSLRPRLIGFVLIMLLKIIRPWCWLPGIFRGNQTKDWYLVTIPTILLPWTLLLWQQKAQRLAKDYSNLEIISAIKRNTEAPVIVASLGFNFIITPLLQNMPMRCDRLVSCRFWQGASDRQQGKLLMMQKVLSPSAIKTALLVTDSEDDLGLLQVVQQPCFVLWSGAKYVDPFQDFWLNALVKKLKKLIKG
ncbi:hypothetical protein C7B62_11035 [Pleurocapsa sp. CCALA 161]|uniref:hypothetical protein n=1 Tax=Pleurocapsa sp. CCALA 161 TaxID=2107688 RepID=UPI000D062656|nr:hypothetical protein [Pleurocapsa sp. CCALA 161]PSB10044.1 hypothetical protein C7B62_11035 [Pleurocapsa sp. CCALA 161]